MTPNLLQLLSSAYIFSILKWTNNPFIDEFIRWKD